MAATTYDLTNTSAEFDYSYAANVSTALPFSTSISAFGTQSSIPISINIGGNFMSSVIINAGYNAHVTDNVTSAPASGIVTTFDIGFSSIAAAASTYTTSPNTKTSGSAGPSNATEGGGDLELGGVLLSTSNNTGITLKGLGDTLILDSPTQAQLAALPITGFNMTSDQIVLNGITDTNAAIVGYNNGVLTFNNNGSTYTLDLVVGTGSTPLTSNFTIGNAAMVEGGNSQTYSGDLVIGYATCFLRGTMIATPAGEVAVETLRAGDLVTVLGDGGPVARPVRWVGSGRMRADRHADRDDASPVRIVRHAFAMNVPHRDLLVTAEHCILTEAGLVPARMLVNGFSILIERSLPDYEYHHIELDRHGILLSEGLSTESYLDTGNRTMFRNNAGGVQPRPGLELAAPLAVAREAVEPIWTRLAERARSVGVGVGLGLDVERLVAPLTDQPDLRLLLDDGSELAACWHNRQRHMFHVPRGARPTRLLSRAAVPAVSVGPFVDDRRRLGVAVERLVLWTGLQERVLPASGLAMNGWHDSENGLRWTDGNAALDLPAAGDETFLDVHVAGTMLYPRQAALDEIRLAA